MFIEHKTFYKDLECSTPRRVEINSNRLPFTCHIPRSHWQCGPFLSLELCMVEEVFRYILKRNENMCGTNCVFIKYEVNL